jgi:preprotein translocase subunit SecE
MNAIITYLKESYSELKKVNWPTKKEVVNLVLIILASVVIAGIVIGVLDFLLTKIVEFITR